MLLSLYLLFLICRIHHKHFLAIEEYHNLYNRKGVTYSQEVLCPLHKSIRNGDQITIHASANNELNSQILDPRLRGYSIDVPRKKSLLVCKLLGCHQCDNFFEVIKEDD